jgi:hypothetical protein
VETIYSPGIRAKRFLNSLNSSALPVHTIAGLISNVDIDEQSRNQNILEKCGTSTVSKCSENSWNREVCSFWLLLGTTIFRANHRCVSTAPRVYRPAVFSCPKPCCMPRDCHYQIGTGARFAHFWPSISQPDESFGFSALPHRDS